MTLQRVESISYRPDVDELPAPSMRDIDGRGASGRLFEYRTHSMESL